MGRAFGLLATLWLAGSVVLAIPVARNHGIVAGVLLGILAATFWLVLAGTARLAWFRLRARRAFRADGGSPPDESRPLAVIEGQLRCVGEPVIAPLSGRSVAVWEYELRGPAPDADGAAYEWSGCGQAACELLTRSGPVPIRAGLLLHELTWDAVQLAEAEPRVDRLLAETPFERIDGSGGARRLFATLDRALDAAGGRFDTRRGIDHRSARASARERVLVEGATVTLLGPFRPGDGLLPLQELIPGPADAVIRGFVREVAVAAAFTLAFSATQGLYFWAVFGSG